MKRDNIETFRLPFLVDDVLDELRWLIWNTASQVALLGRGNLAEAMIAPDAEFGMNETAEAHLAQIDLATFDITRTVKDAYDFAFQVNDPSRFSGDDWGDLMSLVNGSVRSAWAGEISPVCQEGSKLRRVADMVQGRVALLLGDALSIRQLSLLANMIEPAVRSSLSAEGIRTEGRPASLPAATALTWLRGRRGFVPTAYGRAAQHLGTDETALQAKSFPAALQYLLDACVAKSEREKTPVTVDTAFAGRLIAGQEANAGVLDLAQLAKALDVDPSALIDAYVRFVSAKR